MKNNSGIQASEYDIDSQSENVSSGSVVIADIIGLNDIGRPLVSWIANHPTPQEAMTTVPINSNMIGRQVAILFNNGDQTKPVIVGVIQNPLLDLLETQPEDSDNSNNDSQLDTGPDNSQQEIYADGKKVLIEASEEIVLKCGASSITLSKSGKIIIRGKYLMNRSSGVNRILGGSVQIN